MTSTIWMDLFGAEVAQKFYDVGGVRTRTIEAGSGLPLILLHGVGGHAEAYARNIRSHARHFRVIAMDMIGHGLSGGTVDDDYSLAGYARHLGAFIDQIGAARVSLSGESLGAMVATTYAVQSPSRVHKLVLNTGMIAPRSERGMSQLRDLRDRSSRAANELTREAVHDRLRWLMADPDRSITEELIDCRYRIYTQPGRAEVMQKILRVGMPDPANPHWASLTDATIMRGLKCPTLVLWSRHNPGRSAEEAAESAREIPDSRMVVLENSAHWPQWEEQELFDRYHLDFLRD